MIKIVDKSAWIGEQKMQTWWGFFRDSKYIDFVHTSGGQVIQIKL